jgi:hypothetical protein
MLGGDQSHPTDTLDAKLARVRAKAGRALAWLDDNKYPNRRNHACREALESFMREFPGDE